MTFVFNLASTGDPLVHNHVTHSDQSNHDHNSIITTTNTNTNTNTTTTAPTPTALAFQPPEATLLDEIALYFAIAVMVPGCFVVSAFGVCSNTINLIIFYRQGLLTDSCTASLFFLAISDFLACAIKLSASMSFIPSLIIGILLDNPYTQSMVNSGGLGRILNSCVMLFTTTTAWITNFIALERMVSVTFPFHVKRIFTPSRTYIVMISILVIAFAVNAPQILYLKVVFHDTKDSTGPLNFNVIQLTGLIPGHVSENMSAVVEIWILTICFAVNIALNAIIVIKVNKTKEFRKASTRTVTSSSSTSSTTTTTRHPGNSDSKDKNDRTTTTATTTAAAAATTTKKAVVGEKEAVLTKMMIVMCVVYIVCYFPAVLFEILNLYIVQGAKHLLNILDVFAILSVTVNSSFNILIYHTLSTRYRTEFRRLFAWCKPLNTKAG